MQSARKLLQYVRPYKWFAILAPFLMLIEVAMDLLQPAIMQGIIDRGIAEGNHQYVIKMSGWMFTAAVVGLIGGVGCSVYSTKAAVHFAADLRKDVFDKIVHFSNENTGSFGVGKLITIVTNDITTMQTALMMTLRVFVRGPFLFLGSIWIVFLTARELFPILLVAVPLLMICIYFFTARAGALFQRVQEAIDRVNTKLQETLAGIRVIKAFNRKNFETKAFSDVNRKLMEESIGADRFIGILMPVLLFIINMGMIAALWMGALQINQGTLQVGVVLAFINYLTIIMNALVSSSNVLMQITRAFPSAGRVQNVLNSAPGVQNNARPDKTNKIRGEVEFRHVSYSYSKNEEPVLKNLSFKAQAGETVGIIGATGSGKSTLIKLVPRLFDCDEGEIFIDGLPIKNYDIHTLRSAIGFVPQKAILFSGTIEDNLRYGRKQADEEDLNKALEDACADEFVNKFDQGYKHQLMQGAANLSGGQKQRLSMARAFVRKPAILILDDSTSAVDTLSESKIQRALQQHYGESTIFIIASKVASIQHADCILVMDDGRIVGKGTHSELLQTCSVYRDIYYTQVEKGGRIDEPAKAYRS
ncbi:MAG: ABC transporter ATP-binding protein [Bacillus sp. (in: firmicutes)]